MAAPSIGPVTAVAFVATPDVVPRFRSADQVEAYLGLTPREYSSGEQQRCGRISKTGNPVCAGCWWAGETAQTCAQVAPRLRGAPYPARL